MKFSKEKSYDILNFIFPMIFFGVLYSMTVSFVAGYEFMPTVISALIFPIAYRFIPQKHKRKVALAVTFILILYIAARFNLIFNGCKLLLNGIFNLSEQVQNYRYDYFDTNGNSYTEAVVIISLATGFFYAVLGKYFLISYAILISLFFAYFGLTPKWYWLCLSVLFGTISALPKKKSSSSIAAITAFVAVTSLIVVLLLPASFTSISKLDDTLRDKLAFNTVSHEQKITEIQTPQDKEIPPIIEEQDDNSTRKTAVNILFIVLAVLTLTALFVPAIIKDRAEKLRNKNRLGIDDENNSVAICSLYLYSKKWQALNESNVSDTPDKIYEIWQEAAFSNHSMTKEQRDIVKKYTDELVHSVLQSAKFKKKLYIKYWLAL